MKILGEFERSGDAIERRFTLPERRMIGNLARGIVETMAVADDPGGYDDAVVRRLLPDAYPEDPDASAEFSDATRMRLAESKSAGATRILRDLEEAPHGVVRLDADGAVTWLKALGDLRLALAERVGFDTLQRGVATPPGMLYAWLTWLQGSLVDAVDEGAPAAGS